MARISKRTMLGASLMAAAGALTRPATASGPTAAIAPGPFKPAWDSLSSTYRTPQWFADAKFGIWAHWSAQCVPEMGDWYARRMYLQGDPAYDYHVKTYGHPSKVGFMEIDNLWRAERWEPEKLMARYKAAGAKYFMALATHHDNFDAYNSKHHAWNSVKVGAKKDIVGTWEKITRAHGLRFAVSNHSSWAARWFQPAYGYDGEGPLAGVRYDAATLTKADGKGKWWDGLDPQSLYCGPSLVMPQGIRTAAGVREWQAKNTSLAKSNPLPPESFNRDWFVRVKDLVDSYRPDMVYFDTNELPLAQTGLDLVAHYYNTSAGRHGGRADVVVNGKHILPEHKGAFVEDIERGVANGIRPDPWQTDTCIGDWHYSRAVAEENRYKTVGQVARMLIDIVSKNGNLMLNIPLRGDGSIDEHEEAFLDGFTGWMRFNEEGIFASRPWQVHGEGPSVDNPPVPKPGTPKEAPVVYTAQDIRFMVKGGHLYAYALELPESPRLLIRSLATSSKLAAGRQVSRVAILGYDGPVTWQQGPEGLHVDLPGHLPHLYTLGLRIEGVT